MSWVAATAATARPTISRRCPCSSRPCAPMPNAKAGGSPRRSRKSAREPRPVLGARNCCAPPVDEKSMSSSYGGSIAGDGLWSTSSPPWRNWTALKIGFVSLSEALDLTTPSGRAFAGMLAVFAEFECDILRDRVKAGIAQAHKEGRPHGRPATIAGKAQEIRKLAHEGVIAESVP